MKKTNLAGKSREEIGKLLATKSREALIDLIYSLATLEPHFSPGTIAALREMSKRRVVTLIQTGVIRAAHKPTQNGWRVPLSAVQDWDRRTAVTSLPAAKE